MRNGEHKIENYNQQKHLRQPVVLCSPPFGTLTRSFGCFSLSYAECFDTELKQDLLANMNSLKVFQ